MSPVQLRLFLAFADLAIPLLGYFFGNWDFYFILLFFLLDYLVFSVFSFIKEKKIQEYQQVQYKFNFKNLLITLFFISASVCMLLPAMSAVKPDFDVIKDTWTFLVYEDMGIAQGIVLLPLLILGGYSQYRMQFLMTRKFEVAQTTEIWKMHFMTVWLVWGATGLFLGSTYWIVFPSIVYILLLVFGVVTYRFFYTR